MIIETQRTKWVEVSETVKHEIKKYWVVRIIEDTKTNKRCVSEKEFSYEPGLQEIADTLFPFAENGNCFATVEENYRMKEVKNELQQPLNSIV